ncbi:MAG: radical SAM protein [Defluviitaleaceae bacterium]|nr:radical SAM protein [Defluviitaleaceae bacterium]
MFYAKIIHSGNEYMLYDAVTNQFYAIGPDFYNLLICDDERKKNIDKYNEMLREIGLRDLFIPVNHIYEWESSDSEFFGMYEQNLSRMVLSVTEECNMRCSYCLYNFKYDNKFKRRSMKRETAMDSLRYLIAHSDNNNSIILSFYGGEPLLQKKLIQECITKAKSLSPEKTFTYSITTNGLLLSDENIFNFIVDNNIVVNFSLDGPKMIHDRYRFTVNGEGTYDQVIQNLVKLYAKQPDLVGVIAVAAPPVKKDALNDFFSNLPVSVKYSEFIANSEFDNHKHENKQETQVNEYGLSYKITEYAKFHELIPLNDLNGTVPGGPCVLGISNLFVDVDGVFWVCEKADEDNPLFKIGNVTKGLDMSKIKKLRDAFMDEANKLCANCWAIRFCGKCFIHIGDSSTYCAKQKKMLAVQLSEYVNIILKNDNLIHELNSL